MENTDFVIEHIDEEVQVIADQPSVVTNYPANTDFFIENIDSNVISIAHSLNIEASEVDFRPANTDFFIENIDKNVIAIAESMNLSPSEVDFRPANTDFFVENIDKNLIKIAESLSLTPYEVTIRPANTDMFIENIDKNVTLIKGSTNVVTVSGEYININLPDGGKVQSAQLNGNATQTTYSGKNLFDYPSRVATQGAGLTWSLGDDGYFTINGTLTASYTNIVMSYDITDMLVDGQTYTISTSGTGNQYAYTMLAMTNIGTGTSQYHGASTSPYTFTVDKSTYTYRLNAQTTTTTTWGSTSRTLKVGFQLEKSATATDFEKYVGGTPAPNPEFPMPISVVTGEQTVKVTGKNLANLAENTTLPMATNPVTVFDNGQEITVSSLVMTFIMQDAIYTNAGGALIDFQKADGTHQYRTTTQMRDVDNVQPPLNTAFSGTYYLRQTIPITFQKVNVYLGASYANWSQGTASLQLELNTTDATTYEPYQGQDYEVNLGKNLVDSSLVTQGGFNYRTNVEYASTSTIRTPFIRCNPNSTYTVSADGALTEIAVVYAENDGSTIVEGFGYSTTNSTYTFTTPSNAHYMRIRIGGPANPRTPDSDNKWQLELGSTATPYAPYFTPLELAKVGTYQDRIYKDGEKWYVEKQIGKVVLDGSENWTESGFTNSKIYSVYGGAPIIHSSPLLSSEFVFNNSVSSATITEYVSSYNSAVLRLGVLKSRLQTADMAGFKSWLASHPTTVYYALATPTTTEITNQTLIDQLEALASASLGYGVNNIWIEIATGNAMPTLELVIEKY